MLNILISRFRQKKRTIRFPGGPVPDLCPGFLGRPLIEGNCADDCSLCRDLCPVDAITCGDGSLNLDLGKCIFCARCADVCPGGVLKFTSDHQLAVSERSQLKISEKSCPGQREPLRTLPGLYKRSFKMRLVSAGGCNACEADCNVLSTPAWDMGRFGLGFTASPRHADGLLITGPVTANMRKALLKTYEALPSPRVVIAVGSCALTGGIYAGTAETSGGVEELLPVDLYIPGCPPHPLTILDGLLRLLGRKVPGAPLSPG